MNEHKKFIIVIRGESCSVSSKPLYSWDLINWYFYLNSIGAEFSAIEAK